MEVMFSTFVILVCCAPASNKIRIVWMCPSRAEMCKGVCPAVVAESGLALCSRSILTSSLWPMRAAQCRGVWSSWAQGGRDQFHDLNWEICSINKWVMIAGFIKLPFACLTVRWVNGDCTARTFALASACAVFCSRNWATSQCPALEAMWRGVSTFWCGQIKVNQVLFQLH